MTATPPNTKPVKEPDKFNVAFNCIHNEVLEHTVIDKIEELGFDKTDREYRLRDGVTVIYFEKPKDRKNRRGEK